ncbi:glycosyltransferase family 2 protein [Paenibacillus prosopidis]|uniref:Glycosyl transferase family 2 n=1 Tax=Paenibacillus prosopidis TaxID=630520 RepID=A0A368WBV6_9BACL|nr:glycosyltransferase family 2 protein [Paenibacillus prosopidis]RCW50897.1 glycosyl transferase family 2 [Paenibacillus prosopidis]
MGPEEFPLVSVITPSFNQARYIRQTIESVLSQDYPNIEYIVVDGGSSDGTLEILQSYGHLGDRFRYISEPDNGQSHALNKGLHMANGQIIGWLNSDDTYLPGAIRKAVEMFRANPQFGMVYGKAYYTDENNVVLRPYAVEPYKKERLFETCFICQPAAFIRADVFRSMNGVDESLKFCMDYDLWIRVSKNHPLGYIDDVLATSRLHDECKTIAHWGDIGLPEIVLTSLKHYGAVSGSWVREFLRVNGPQSMKWLFEQIKAHNILGPLPTITEMNRYYDHWVPPRFRINVVSSEGNPNMRVRIQGSHMIPNLMKKLSKRLRITVYINGRKVKRLSFKKGPFVIDLPFKTHRSNNIIELVSSTRLVPRKAKINADRRVLSSVIHDVVAYSAAEQKLYQILMTNPMEVGNWFRQYGVRR